MPWKMRKSCDCMRLDLSFGALVWACSSGKRRYELQFEILRFIQILIGVAFYSERQQFSGARLVFQGLNRKGLCSEA